MKRQQRHQHTPAGSNAGNCREEEKEINERTPTQQDYIIILSNTEEKKKINVVAKKRNKNWNEPSTCLGGMNLQLNNCETGLPGF